MWIVYAVGSSFFAGITSILAKCGIRETDSNVATAIRTVVVLIFSWLMVFLTDAWPGIGQSRGKTMLFLILSGLATGASWLCYFRALQTGDINKVVPIDKSSTVLTILLAFIFLHEGVTPAKIAAVFDRRRDHADDLKKRGSGRQRTGWRKLDRICFSVGCVCKSDSHSGKNKITGVDSNLGTAIRTTVVLFMAWIMVFVTGRQHEIRKIRRNELFFIVLSGLATGASWLCYYRALQDGAASVVVPIDKLSILVTIAFSWIVFHEKLSKKAGAGVVLITAGTVMLAVL